MKSRKDNVRQALKDLHGAKKLEYIWDYFHFYIVLGVIVIALVIVTLVQINSTGKTYAEVTVLNAYDSESCKVSLQDELNTGIEMKSGYSITVDAGLKYDPESTDTSSAEDLQVLAARIMTGEADLLVGNTAVFDSYASNGGLEDLSSVLPEDILNSEADRMYYAKDTDGNEIIAGVWTNSFSSDCSQDSVLVGIVSQSVDQAADLAVLEYLIQ